LKKSRLLGAVCIIAIALLPLSNANAALVTHAFDGVFHSAGSLFNVGDTFSGKYTFDNTVSAVPHPDSTLDTQTKVISDSLLGTGWELTVFSTAIPDFTVSGTISGYIAIGDNTTFGDRYIATLSSSNPLPGGLNLNFFQIDLQDPISSGADMLSSGAIDTLPNILLAGSPTGRFFITNETNGCTQCSISVTSLTSVPIPAAVWLFGSGLLGMIVIARRKKAA